MWSPQREKINPHRCLRQVDSMGTTTMPEHSGAWWSYPIYAAGLFVGVMSPEQWLVALSLVAVIIRIVIDLPKAGESVKKLKWWAPRPPNEED